MADIPAAGGSWYSSPSVWAAAIPTALTLISGLFAPKPHVDFSTTQSAFDQKLAFDQAKQTQDAALQAQQIAASGAGAKATAGAMVAVANIQKGIAEEQMKEKRLADAFANRITTGTHLADLTMQQGVNAQAGFNSVASVLGGLRHGG